MKSALGGIVACALTVGFASTQTSAPAYRKEVERKRTALLALPFATAGETLLASGRKSQAYRALFETVTASELKSLAKDPDLSLALQAGWEQARKPVQTKEPTQSRSGWIYDPVAMSSFVAVFEKRTSCQPPKWWSDAICHFEVVPDRYGANLSVINADTANQRGLVQSGTPAETTISDGVHHVVAKALHGSGFLTIFDRGRAYVENYEPSVSWPSSVTCYDLKSGKTLWTQDVWGNRRGFFNNQTIRHHPLQMLIHNQQIVVFGSEMGCYAESFKIADGTPIYKFCSSYWYNFPEAWRVPWNPRTVDD